jgi:hypothetical protein
MKQQESKPLFDAQSAGVAIELIHASVILLRLLSRCPGSIGGRFLFPGVLWSLVCFAFLSQHPERNGELERGILTLIGWLWLIHMLAFFASWRGGKGTYAWHTGVSWLNKFFPGANHPILIAILNDGTVAVILAAICDANCDAGMAKYWLICAALSLVSHALIGSRDIMRRINVGSASDQQAHWQSFIPQDHDLE